MDDVRCRSVRGVRVSDCLATYSPNGPRCFIPIEEHGSIHMGEAHGEFYTWFVDRIAIQEK